MNKRLKKEISIALLAVGALYVIYKLFAIGYFYAPIIALGISTIMLFVLGACKGSGNCNKQIDDYFKKKEVENEN